MNAVRAEEPLPLDTAVDTSGPIATIAAPAGLSEVEITGDEGTSLCLLTGQPDYWTLSIRYAPNEDCLESKALKFYLQGYRQRAVFVETLAAAILADVVASCAPEWCSVTVHKKARGGLAITATARHGDVPRRET